MLDKAILKISTRDVWLLLPIALAIGATTWVSSSLLNVLSCAAESCASQGGASPAMFWYEIALNVSIGPLVEEILCRRLFLGELLVKRLRLRFAVPVSALVFALLHGPAIAQQSSDYAFIGFNFIQILVGGWLLGTAYIRSGSLLLCTMLHCFVNIFVLLPKPSLVSSELLTLIGNDVLYSAILALVVVCLILLIYMLWIRHPKLRHDSLQS